MDFVLPVIRPKAKRPINKKLRPKSKTKKEMGFGNSKEENYSRCMQQPKAEADSDHIHIPQRILIQSQEVIDLEDGDEEETQTYVPRYRGMVKIPVGIDEEEYDKDSWCSICHINKTAIALVPCGHMAMCFQCTRIMYENQETGECPICKTIVKDLLRIYKI